MNTVRKQKPVLTETQRSEILEKLSQVVAERFYDPQLHQIDWVATVARCRANIVSASSDEAFEVEITRLLGELDSSHLGFYHTGLKRCSAKMALCAQYAALPLGDTMYWTFQTVHEGGPAARAGIRPGDILLSVDGRSFHPPQHPSFSMDSTVEVGILTRDLERVVRTIAIPKPKRKANLLPYVEPSPVVAHKRIDRETGYIRIAMYPGEIGVEVANEVSSAVQQLNPVSRLIFDLRGNTGGGIGVLRVMSLLTAERLPVGLFINGKMITGAHSHDDALVFDRIPKSKHGLIPLAVRFGSATLLRKLKGRKAPIAILTEGMGVQRFHGRVVLLVDRHTASANEILVGFARETGLATIVGEPTPGRLLGGSKFRLPHGYWVALPVGEFRTAEGMKLEGRSISPDVEVPFDPTLARTGVDLQLAKAIEVVSQL
jgi:carboxyl-terminal processing protease